MALVKISPGLNDPEVARTFNFTAPPSGYTVTGGTLIEGVGRSITGSPPSFVVNYPAITAENNPLRWLVIRMKSPSAQYGGVYFGGATTDQDQDQNYSFPIRGDNVMHTYNVWLGDNFLIPRRQSDVDLLPGDAPGTSGFTKLVLQISKITGAGNLKNTIRIFPTFDNPSGSGVVEWMNLQRYPEGPPVLIIEHVGPARAMNRVNDACVWCVRIRNAGGTNATGITLTFSALSSGLSVDTGSYRNVPTSIPPDQDRTIYFEVTSTVQSTTTTPDTLRYLTLKVSCTGDTTGATRRGRVYISGPTPGGLPAGQIPNPVIPTNPYDLYCWHFPGWGSNPRQHMSIAHTAERRPEVGPYDQTTVRVLDWEIYWAAQHGIKAFFFEWIDSTGFCEDTVNAFLTCTKLPYMKFALSYINTDGPLSSTTPKQTIHTGTGAPSSSLGSNNQFYVDTATNRLYGPKTAGAWGSFITAPVAWVSTLSQNHEYINAANFLDLIRRWDAAYFGNSQYLRDDNNKLHVGVFRGDKFYQQINDLAAGVWTAAGDAWMAAVLGRAEVIAGGAGSIAWDGNVQQNQGGGSNPTRFSDAGFVYSSRYGWGAFAGPQHVHTPDATNAFAQNTFWNQQTNGGLDPLLALFGSYDNRRWLDMRSAPTIVQSDTYTQSHSGMSYETFKEQCAAAKAYLDALPAARGRRLLVCSWNEWGEDSCVGPTGQKQFLFLRALFETFCTGTVPTPVVPQDVASMTITMTDNLWRWVEFPSAYPTEDGNTNLTTHGVTILPEAYP